MASISAFGSIGRKRSADVVANHEFRSHVLLLAVVLAGCWAALSRFWGQWLDPNYPMSGLFTMAAAALVWGARFRARRDRLEAIPVRWYLAIAFLLAAYALVYAGFPKLVSSAVAVLAMALVFLATLPQDERATHWGLLPWMAASLPLGLAVNAYFGYPLRMAAGQMASIVLVGRIQPLGAGLSDGVNTVFLDAPCSGIQMIRISLLLAGIVAVLLRLRFVSSVTLCILAGILALLGNVARICVLFLAFRRGEVSDALHQWSGTAIFACCAAVLLLAGFTLARRHRDWIADTAPGEARQAARRWPLAVLAAGAAAAFLVPFTVAETPSDRIAPVLPWPAGIDGDVLRITSTDPMPAKYRDTFLGTAVQGTLVRSGDSVLLRQTSVATLTLHATEQCYRAFGYACSPLPAVRDARGHLWSRFKAVHPDGRVYAVRQCFFSVEPGVANDSGDLAAWIEGRPSWPDVSSWYWAAARPGSGVRLTLAVAIAEVIDGEPGED